MNSVVSLKVPETYIKDPGLAEAMAYGENPHRVLAKIATKLGLADEASEQLGKAEIAGVTAGREYIRELTDNLLADSKASEALETDTSFEVMVERTKQALANHYAEHGTKPEDFCLISYQDKKGKAIDKVVYAGQAGLDLGDQKKDCDSRRSYDSLMVNNMGHLIAVNSKKVDARIMTETDYRAFIQSEIEQGTNLPDSINTITLLPGEGLVTGNARFGFVIDRQAGVRWINRDDGSQALRFRPSVDIDEVM